VTGLGGPPQVSVVLVTYNSAEHIGRCLTAMANDGTRRTREFVVLDNASTDDTVAVVRALSAPACRLYVSSLNLGFASGANAGVAQSTGRWVLLVNPDAVVAPGAVDALVDFAEQHPDAGPIGGRTFRPDGSVDPRSCWGRQTLWSTFCFATGLSSALRRSTRFNPESLGAWGRDAVREVGTVTGYFMLVSRAHWDALGGLDPTFFMYGDDVDFSERARRLGLRPMITPDAVTQHSGGASSVDDERAVMLLRGRLTLMDRHWGRLARRLGRLLIRAGVLLRAVAAPRSPWPLVWRQRAQWTEPYPVVTRGIPRDAAGAPVVRAA